MGEGGAVLTHSGGAFGTVLGGMTELAIRGKTKETSLSGALATVPVSVSSWLGHSRRSSTSNLPGCSRSISVRGRWARWGRRHEPVHFSRAHQGRRSPRLISTMAATVAGGLAAWLWTGSKAPPITRATRLWPLLRA